MPNPMTQPNATRDRIQERFEAFHQANPIVLELFVRFARELRAAGRPSGGAKAIFERIRWEMDVTTREPRKAGADFKLNNNYASRYARLAMDTHEDLAGFFRVRSLGGQRPKARPQLAITPARPQQHARRTRRTAGPAQLALNI